MATKNNSGLKYYDYVKAYGLVYNLRPKRHNSDYIRIEMFII